MAERNPSRPWSDEEDALLISAVQLHGEQDNWLNVASLVPGRTNKACRKRWLHSLSPTVRKTAWTQEEDKQLLALYKNHGAKWSIIAREIPGRTDDACSKRYREALDPHLKKHDWTPAEDEKLMTLHAEIGGKWGQLGQELQRSGLGCRNRYRLLAKRASKVVFDRIPDDDPTSGHVPAPDADPPPQIVSDTQFSPDSSIADWLPSFPYYPPEAYPCFPGEESSGLNVSFREPTPEAPIPPHVAPFQFSSSSLSAALSDPPQNSRSLPTIYESESSPSTAFPDPSHDIGNLEDFDHQPLLDDFSLFEPDSDLSQIFLGVHFDADGVFHYPQGDLPPIHSSIDANHHDPWDQFPPDIFSTSSPSIQLPSHGLDASPIDHTPIPDNPSSTLSTPFNFSLSLSDLHSPNPSTPIEIFDDEDSDEPVPFVPDPRLQLPKRASRRLLKKTIRPQGPTRLSSMLALTPDSSVRPYACGRGSCWPGDVPLDEACFATSKELFDHSRIDHVDDPPGDRPFRCALAGCGKSWKSLNGLQYHLQLSTAHFKNAMSSSFSSQRSTNPRRPSSASGSSTDKDSGDEPKRTYVCHYPHCFKAYRQPSGLRYHLKHGHPSEMPAQLALVPPALARQLPSKTKKMRRKTSIEDDA